VLVFVGGGEDVVFPVDLVEFGFLARSGTVEMVVFVLFLREMERLRNKSGREETAELVSQEASMQSRRTWRQDQPPSPARTRRPRPRASPERMGVVAISGVKNDVHHGLGNCSGGVGLLIFEQHELLFPTTVVLALTEVFAVLEC
jgi:hypothetical protein